ncbi:hypothetical protein [Massilia sp. HP4]|uniref:hypothetical protein n=1 Tax=Massilia sp. HP4 TaxID=2562316 RepID=UPI0010C10047|nr:hypothetical protein [Massilia sp. HP4]
MTYKNHPVWGVYNKLRTARLNVKYYCRRLEQAEKWNSFFEILVLATAPTSAVAGLWFWQTEYGKIAWQWLGCIAAFAVLLKPAYTPGRKIKQYEGVVVGYRALEYDLMEIKTLIEQKGKYDGSLQGDFKRALQREKVLVGKNPETTSNLRVLEQCEQEVRNELPDSYFITPGEKDDRLEEASPTEATSATTSASRA